VYEGIIESRNKFLIKAGNPKTPEILTPLVMIALLIMTNASSEIFRFGISG